MTALMHSETPNERIGRAILSLAAARGLSKINAIAEALGMTDDTLRRRLNGETKKGWLATELLTIADVLDVPVSLLLESDPAAWFRREPSGDTSPGVTLSEMRRPQSVKKTATRANKAYCSTSSRTVRVGARAA